MSYIRRVMLYLKIFNKPIRFLGWGYGVFATSFSILSSALGCRLIFGFFDSRKGIVSPAKRVELPGQNGGVILSIAGDNFVSATWTHYYGGMMKPP